jgi:hypothetical protein
MTTYQKLAGRLRTGTANPSVPQEGDMYYHSTDNTWMRYDGTDWRGVAMVTTSTSSSTSTSTSTTTTA